MRVLKASRRLTQKNIHAIHVIRVIAIISVIRVIRVQKKLRVSQRNLSTSLRKNARRGTESQRKIFMPSV